MITANYSDYVDGGSHKDFEISVVETETTYDNSQMLSESIKLDEALCSEQNLRFGSCEASQFSVQIANSEISLEGKTLEVSVTMDEETTKYGTFKVISDKPTADRIWRVITAYDKMYDIINADVLTWYNGLTFPMTLANFRNSFFNHLGISQVSTNLINDSFSIPGGFSSTGSLSGKTIITAICEFNGVFGHINRDGNFEYISLDNADSFNCPPYENNSVTYQDYVTSAITKVTMRGSASDVGTSVGVDGNEYIITNNPLIYGTEGSQALITALTNLLNKISLVTFRPFELKKTIGNPCVELGDKIVITTKYQTINSFVLKRCLSGIQALRDSYSATGDKTYPKEVNTIQSQINRIAGKTSELSYTVDGLQSTVTRVEQTANTAITRANGSITTDTLHYLATPLSSGVTTETAGWTTTPQSMTPTNKYLWTYHTYAHGNGSTTDTTPVITGVYGEDGQQGQPGTSVTITSQTVTYQASSSGTVTPTGTWSTSVPSVSQGQYLWTRTIVNYSNGTSTTSYSVSYQGQNGQGVNVSSVTYKYAVSDNKKTLNDYLVSFNDGADAPLDKCVAYINPVQDLHGYDHPWAGGNGKNKLEVTANTTTVTDVTFTVNDDGTINVNGTAGLNRRIFIGDFTFKAGVTYTLSGCPAGGGGSSYCLFTQDTNPQKADIGNGVTFTFDSDTYSRIAIIVYNGASVSNKLFKPMICTSGDSTFEPYSNICPITGFTDVDVTVNGFNQWDEEWELGQYDIVTGEKQNSNSAIRSKNYIPVLPSATYFIQKNAYAYVLFYDEGKNFISYVGKGSSSTFSIPVNCKYITFSAVITTYNNDICINISKTTGSPKNGDYRAYNGHTYNISWQSQAGTVYSGNVDLITGLLTVDMASVDLGSLTWVMGIAGVFSAEVSGMKEGLGNILTAKYPYDNSVSFLWGNAHSLADKTIYRNAESGNHNVYIKDTAYTDAQSFTTAMNGVQLVYELATPLTYQLTPQQINSLLGSNNIWNDTNGRTEVKYLMKDMVVPESGWVDSLPDVPQGSYLWTNTKTTYTDGNISNTYTFSKQGDGVVEVTSIYYASDSSTLPSAPTEMVTSTSTSSYNTWTKGIPTLTTTYKYLYTCDQIKYTNNTYTWSTVVLNNALTEMKSSISQLAGEIVLKVDNNGNIVKVALDASASTGTTFKVDADNIDFMANGVMNFSANQIGISATNFSVDKTTGNMTCTGGTIGGFTISSSSIYNGMESLSDTTHNGVYIGTDGIALGKGAFKVTSAGAISATNATILGSITFKDTIRCYDTNKGTTFNVFEYSVQSASQGLPSEWQMYLKDPRGNVLISAASNQSPARFYGRSDSATVAYNNILKDSDNGSAAIYWKKSGYGDKFQIKPQFSGADDFNYLAINGAVGGAGTDPSLYELMRITGKTGKLQVKGDIYYSSGNRRAVGSYTDSTFYIANELMTFKSSNNAIVTGGKGNYIWAISSWSDSRLKKNIKDSEVNALDVINKIQMREFDFKDEKYGHHEDIGYVAHELREIVPECVVDIPISEEEQKEYKTDTLMQVEDKHLIKYLVKAVQELSKEVERLKNK